jgi:hypothetical protein
MASCWRRRGSGGGQGDGGGARGDIFALSATRAHSTPQAHTPIAPHLQLSRSERSLVPLCPPTPAAQDKAKGARADTHCSFCGNFPRATNNDAGPPPHSPAGARLGALCSTCSFTPPGRSGHREDLCADVAGVRRRFLLLVPPPSPPPPRRPLQQPRLCLLAPLLVPSLLQPSHLPPPRLRRRRRHHHLPAPSGSCPPPGRRPARTARDAPRQARGSGGRGAAPALARDGLGLAAG